MPTIRHFVPLLAGALLLPLHAAPVKPAVPAKPAAPKKPAAPPPRALAALKAQILKAGTLTPDGVLRYPQVSVAGTILSITEREVQPNVPDHVTVYRIPLQSLTSVRAIPSSSDQQPLLRLSTTPKSVIAVIADQGGGPHKTAAARCFLYFQGDYAARAAQTEFRQAVAWARKVSPVKGP